MSIKVNAHCLKQTFRNGDFCIFQWNLIEPNENIILSKYSSFSTKGEHSFITPNKDYELELKLISQNQNFGGTYDILSCPSLNQLDFTNLTREESFEILMDCTSSERIANNILDAYENFIELILTQGKEIIDVSKVRGMGDVYLNVYARNLLDKYKYYGLLKEFSDYKVDISDVKALCEQWIDLPRIKENIEKNPYKTLIHILKRSFESADKLILELRPELRVSKIRCEYLILSVLEKNEENDKSSRLNGNDLYYYIVEQGLYPELESLIVPVAKSSEMIYYDEDSKDLSIMSTYLGEVKIAEFIKEKLENKNPLDWDWEQFKEIKDGVLTEEQSSVLKLICEESIVVLNAAGGTGKSSSMMAVLQMLDHYKKTYKCVTFTGKAAKRLSEQTNRPASTIHRATIGSVITEDWLIIDEDSMLDINLMCMLINAIENDSIRVLLIGDSYQLPSIGIGRIIKDIIESQKVPTCTLTKCFRFGEGGMAKVSTLTRQGKFYIEDSDIDKNEILLGKNKDYKYIKSDGTIDQILSEYQKLIDKKIKPDDICVLTPHNINEYGTININNHIQALINPPKPNETTITIKVQKQEVTFRQRDIIMNTKNNYNILTEEGYNMLINDETGMLTKDDVKTTEIFNGSMGKVLEVSTSYIKAKFDEEIVVLNKLECNNLLLGYSSNPYKMQGSQNKWLIVLTLGVHKKSLNRQLRYTALTRASDGIVEIGDIDIMQDSLLTIEDDNRSTWLKELLLTDNTIS